MEEYREEYRKELEELKEEVRSLREEFREFKAALLPFMSLFQGNGFKKALLLMATGSSVALVGIYHFVNTTARYVIEVIRAFRGM